MEQRLAAHDFVGVIEEVAKDAELALREIDRQIALRRLIFSKIELDVAERDLFAGGGALRPSHHRFQPRQKLHEAERLRDVVVGAELQADDLVDLLPARGEHDDRRVVATPAQLAADVEAALLRQHHIEDDHVVIAARCGVQSFFPIRCHLDDMLLEFEAIAQCDRHRRIVFHYENSAHAASGSFLLWERAAAAGGATLRGVAAAVGSTIVNVLPSPGALLTSTRPPCAFTTWLTM